MKSRNQYLNIQHRWPWIVGAGALLWVLLRSGTNPKRLSYPCQKAAMPLAINWLLAVVAFFAGSYFFQRFAKFSTVALLIAGVVWFVGSAPDFTRSEIQNYESLPVWEVYDPVSRVFVMDSIPLTTGSLAAGDASVPDEYLSDPAIDTLVAMLEAGGVFLHQTASHPDGIVSSDDIVIIKGNFQWTHQNTTSPDRIKGLIWQIFNHPDGYSGEIIVCDNTQEIGTGINDDDDNSEDTNQSILDVASTFQAKGYPVYVLDWNYIWDDIASEYSEGDYTDGYVYETDTRISYPKFRSPSGNYYISLRHGIWDSLSAFYDDSRLCIIDFPVLKSHGMAGATIAVKNWIGVLTTAHADARYGGWGAMHYRYFFTSYSLVARVMAATFPALSIVDATWTSTENADNLSWLENTRMLVASTDPAAASWYAAKFILTPIARNPNDTDPDRAGSDYSNILGNWTTYLRNTEGLPCTNDSLEISASDRSILNEPAIWFTDRTVDDSQGNDNGRIDSGETIHLTVTLSNSSLNATGVTATLTSDDPDIEIIQDTSPFGDLARGESADNENNPYSFSVSSEALAHMSTFHLNVTADGGYEKTIGFELLVGTPTILLIDDDGGDVYEDSYTNGLRIKQIYPEVWDVSLKGTPPIEELQQYETVLWTTGDDRNSSLTSDEQSVLADLLSDGGKLFIAGQNIGYDLVEDGSASDSAFFTDYLHAEYISDSIEENFLYGVQGDPISGEYTFLTINENQTSPSAIAPLEGSSPVLLYQISREAATIKYEGDYRVVYFALGLEGIGSMTGDDEEVRGTLMANAIQWLSYEPMAGDVNQDGMVNVLDVLMTVNIILKVTEPTPSQEWAADCNADGVINILDVVGIVNVILGIGTCPPSGMVKISPATIAYLRSLESHLTEENFDKLMALLEEVRIPSEYRLLQNYPNPFNPFTDIRYQIPAPSRDRDGIGNSRLPIHTTLKIYNILGQKVRTLVDQVQDPGYYSVTWDGRNSSGHEVPSGVYFYRLITGNLSETRRMMLLK